MIVAWFAILFTGRYPRGIFDFVEGAIRWGNRVTGYAFLLVTDSYPPSVSESKAVIGQTGRALTRFADRRLFLSCEPGRLGESAARLRNGRRARAITESRGFQGCPGQG